MPKRVSITTGFVTNSSSVIHHFPNELLSHPKIAAFLKAFEIEDGFIGEDLWDRSACTSVAITKEQKQEVLQKLQNEEFATSHPVIDVDADKFVVIFGDEYRSIANMLTDLIGEVLVEQHGGDRWDHLKGEYN